MWDVGCGMLGVECDMLDVKCWMLSVEWAMRHENISPTDATLLKAHH